ncbi:MAG TPA: preprotein translocase subunit SecA [Dehalococcoidia bacterium]|nr:preprotein translocase subunit SecA [Dehalococcoidia bacterium]
MLKWLGSLVDSNEKEVKKLQSEVRDINELEPGITDLTAEQLRGRTDEFKSRLESGEELDSLLPEAFAAVREAAWRSIKQRHFDVQLMGGIVLHQGKIAEMKTGEGKTLVATLPLYLNSLSGCGCHLITVNDYLAKRDAHWMGAIFHTLGVSVAVIQHEASFLYDPSHASDQPAWRRLKPVSRREAYAADITYGTNHEFGFDYLRDNMVLDRAQCVQRPLHYAIVDEVDNILIDEARTPLIISGAAEDASDKYAIFARLLLSLKAGKKDEETKEEEGDYIVDEKTRAATLTNDGWSKMERALKAEGLLKSPSIDDEANFFLKRYLENALKAQAVFRRDRDYVVKGGEVIIVDEFTGRLMVGRRYSEGLHQAIEAKEHVKVQRENVTMATITLQNYFRMYSKLAGMTGTAATEHEEFHKIYKLDVVMIPTNKDMVRRDLTDQVYKTETGKFKAVANEIQAMNKESRPVLVGTVSIEKSEQLSEILKKRGVPHQVLNAKYHEKEAVIIAQAGGLGAVTVATNMAGRGVDIILGGKAPDPGQYEKEGEDPQYRKEYENWEADHRKVVGLGGLHIVGTERHEARRIDNQLRGRAGRQGDPGSSRFYVSLEDDVVKRFGGDRIKSIMDWAGLDEDTPIENSLVARAIENAQVRVEGFHFDMRKHLVEYDDVVNKHREVIYQQRKLIIGKTDRNEAPENIRDWVGALVRSYLSHGDIGVSHVDGLVRDLKFVEPSTSLADAESISGKHDQDVEEELVQRVQELCEEYAQKADSSDTALLERLARIRVKAAVRDFLRDELLDLAHRYVPDDRGLPSDAEGLLQDISAIMPLPAGLTAESVNEMPRRDIEAVLVEHAEKLYQEQEDKVGPTDMRILERLVMLRVIDILWIEHLTAMEQMRQGIGLRAVGNIDPLVVYKKEGHAQFSALMASIRHDVAHTIFHVTITREQAKPTPMAQQARSKEAVAAGHIGRNNPCPCGSGKKYKKCCGK